MNALTNVALTWSAISVHHRRSACGKLKGRIINPSGTASVTSCVWFCNRYKPEPHACMSCRRVSAPNGVIVWQPTGLHHNIRRTVIETIPSVQMLLSSRRLPGTDVSLHFEQTCLG